MSVLIVTPSLNAGGTERIAASIANHWASQEKRSVSMAVFELEDAATYYPLDHRVKLRRIGGVRPALRGWRAAGTFVRRISRIRREIRTTKADIVISFLTRTNVVVLIASLGLGVPVVISERNSPQNQPLAGIWRVLRRFTYPKAFGLITMTNGAMSYFPKTMRKRAWVIPNPLTTVHTVAKGAHPPVLVAVGRLVPQKGFDLLLEAFARVANQYPDWTLSIWGEGQDKARLEEQRNALGLAHRVVFAGRSAQPGSWLNGSSAFVLSSRYEGWGNALLEALAAGLPCVSFDCKWGPSEMIQDGVNGLLVPPENVDGLASALSRVMGDHSLRESLSRAATESVKRFSKAEIMPLWDQVLSETTSASNSRTTSV